MNFIDGIGMISPQQTLVPGRFPDDVVEYTADFLKCIEPVYKTYIDPIPLRRMSRLIRMGISSARMCLADAGIAMPDAIITGTGLGSVEDTEKILSDISKEEKFLNPTPFIQSTYNTISSQIAIHLKCHNYNTTYVHRTFSFESGLIDGMLQLSEGSSTRVLVGGIDEMTLNHLNITRRIGLWKRQPVNNLQLLNSKTPGALAGEGAAFFLISADRSDHSYARLRNLSTLIDIRGSYRRDQAIRNFLLQNQLQPEDIDFLIVGISGDAVFDPVYHQFASDFFPNTPLAWYKHLCGEYHTSTGFALYTAAQILKSQECSEILLLNHKAPSRLKNILIYNQFRNINHSFLLVSSTD